VDTLSIIARGPQYVYTKFWPPVHTTCAEILFFDHVRSHLALPTLPIVQVTLASGAASFIDRVNDYTVISVCKYQLHQDMLSNNDTMMQDMKPNVTGMQQPARPSSAVNVSILENLSQARLMNNGASMRIPSIDGNLVAMHMPDMISNGMDSTVPVSQTMISRIVQSTVPVPGSFTSNMSGSLSQPLGYRQGSVRMGQTCLGILMFFC
ncbi:hypothetical protein Tco_1040930, partial [Tanacetum coccineum]